MVGVLGTLTITNSSVSANAHNGFWVRNTSGTLSSMSGHRQQLQRRQRHHRRQRVPVRGLGHLDAHVGHDQRQHVPEQHAAAGARGPGARHGDRRHAHRLRQHLHRQRDPRELHAGHLVEPDVQVHQQRLGRDADDRQRPAGRQRVLLLAGDRRHARRARSRATASAMRPSPDRPGAPARSAASSRARPTRRCSSTATSSARPTATRARSDSRSAGRRRRSRTRSAPTPSSATSRITNNDVVPGAAPSGFPLSAIMVEADNQSGADNKSPTVRADIRGNTVPAGTAFDLLSTQHRLLRVRRGQRARHRPARRHGAGERRRDRTTHEHEHRERLRLRRSAHPRPDQHAAVIG